MKLEILVWILQNFKPHNLIFYLFTTSTIHFYYWNLSVFKQVLKISYRKCIKSMHIFY